MRENAQNFVLKHRILIAFLVFGLFTGGFLVLHFRGNEYDEPVQAYSELARIPAEVPTEPAIVRDAEWLVPYYEENSSLVGWIRIPGTVIDFPIYQSGTAYTGRSHEPYWDFYLTSNRDGRRGDGEVYVWPDHQNHNVSIDEADLFFMFAHNFRYWDSGEIWLGEDGEIRQFSELPFFEEDEFWEENRDLFFTTLDGEERAYEVAWIFELDSVVSSNGHVSVRLVNPDTRSITSTEFEFMQQRTFASEAEFTAFVQLMNEYAIQYSDDVAYGDRLVFLLTCQTRPYVSSRRLVLAARHRE